eukprot:15440902-Alexandrium_andersonii.AAC.1
MHQAASETARKCPEHFRAPPGALGRLRETNPTTAASLDLGLGMKPQPNRMTASPAADASAGGW